MPSLYKVVNNSKMPIALLTRDAARTRVVKRGATAYVSLRNRRSGFIRRWELLKLLVITAITEVSLSGTPAAGKVGTAYTFAPTVAGGEGTRSFASVGTALPAGLSISSTTGAITGTPTAAGTTDGVAIRMTDSTGSYDLSGLTITVAP